MSRNVNVIIQKGQTANQMEDALAAGLADICADSFGDARADVTVSWERMEQGRAFTNFKPSTSSLILVPAPDDISEDDRVALMHKLCDFWMAETGCALDEVIATVINQSAVSA